MTVLDPEVDTIEKFPASDTPYDQVTAKPSSAQACLSWLLAAFELGVDKSWKLVKLHKVYSRNSTSAKLC